MSLDQLQTILVCAMKIYSTEFSATSLTSKTIPIWKSLLRFFFPAMRVNMSTKKKKQLGVQIYPFSLHAQPPVELTISALSITPKSSLGFSLEAGKWVSSKNALYQVVQSAWRQNNLVLKQPTKLIKNHIIMVHS